MSELNRIVHFSTLRTPRALDIGIVGVNVAAVLAAEDTVFAGSRIESAAAQLGIDRGNGHPRQQDDNVGQDQMRRGHLKEAPPKFRFARSEL